VFGPEPCPDVIEFATSVPHPTTVAPGPLVLAVGGAVGSVGADVAGDAVAVAIGVDTAVVCGTCALMT
jgi:hypothetical protein